MKKENNVSKSITDMNKNMASMFYALWYTEDISPHLSKEQKTKLLNKLAKFSREHVLTEPGINYPLSDFPELKPYTHTKSLSGLQLATLMFELFNELNPEMKFQRPYPYMTFPSKRLKS